MRLVGGWETHIHLVVALQATSQSTAGSQRTPIEMTRKKQAKKTKKKKVKGTTTMTKTATGQSGPAASKACARQRGTSARMRLRRWTVANEDWMEAQPR